MKNIFGKLFLIFFNTFGVVYIFGILYIEALGFSKNINMYDMLQILCNGGAFDIRSVMSSVSNWFNTLKVNIGGISSNSGLGNGHNGSTGSFTREGIFDNEYISRGFNIIINILASIYNFILTIINLAVNVSVIIGYILSSLIPLIEYLTAYGEDTSTTINNLSMLLV